VNRLSASRPPSSGKPGPTAGKESRNVRCNTPNLALEGQVLAGDRGTDDRPHLGQVRRPRCEVRSPGSYIRHSEFVIRHYQGRLLPRLCPAALPSLARPDHLWPDPGERGAGAAGEMVCSRPEVGRPRRHPLRRLQRPRARAIAVAHCPRSGGGHCTGCPRLCGQPVRDGQRGYPVRTT